jgi:hypothetical protein
LFAIVFVQTHALDPEQPTKRWGISRQKDRQLKLGYSCRIT